MLTYVIRRLLLMIPTLFGITLLVFLVMAYSPGGVGGPRLNEGGNMKAEDARRVREYYNKRYGLDKPPIVQYGRWLNQLSPLGYRVSVEKGLHDFGWKWPDLGESLVRHRPVTDLIRESLPITMLLNAISIPIVYTIGILTGLLAARYRGRWIDVTSGGLLPGALVCAEHLGRRDAHGPLRQPGIPQAFPDRGPARDHGRPDVFPPARHCRRMGKGLAVRHNMAPRAPAGLPDLRRLCLSLEAHPRLGARQPQRGLRADRPGQGRFRPGCPLPPRLPATASCR